MIKFFRNIRKNLLTEGKTTKYFKYAVGEIILVVIGILIALQINNWNENKRYKKEIRTKIQAVLLDMRQNDRTKPSCQVHYTNHGIGIKSYTGFFTVHNGFQFLYHHPYFHPTEQHLGLSEHEWDDVRFK